MSAIQKFQDPGLPEHVHRKSDIDVDAEKRAERQVAILFLLSAVGTVGTVVSYIFIKSTSFVYLPILGNTNAAQLGLGVGLAASLFFIGMGAIHWARTLMPDNEVIAERHEFRSEEGKENHDCPALACRDSGSGPFWDRFGRSIHAAGRDFDFFVD